MTSPISDNLAKLRKQFADQLPGKLEKLRTQFQRLDPSNWMPAEAEVLRRLLHSLTGSAGTFGMMSVSNVSRDLENQLTTLLTSRAAPAAKDWRAFSADLNRLDKLARINLESNAPSLKAPAAPLRGVDRSPLIHLVEDDPAQAEHLSQALQEDNYRVQIFSSTKKFRDAFTSAGAECPAVVIMDMIFSDSDSTGAQVVAELRATYSHCPPVIFASVRDDLHARLAAFRAGACRYMVKPVDSESLLALLDALTGRQPEQPYKILMVDDELQLLEAQAEILREAGMEVVTLSQPLLAVEMLNEFTPDVLVLDVYMPDASGPELAAVLREREEQLHLPILFLSAETDISQQLLALNLGGDDFLVKPVRPEHLVAAITARAKRSREHKALRRRLETKLYESEREHLALNQHAIVSIADRAGNITYVNDKFCKISGYTNDELMGQNHRILKSGVHAPEFYHELWRTIAAGNIWQGEICNRSKDGSLYWVASTITPFLDIQGEPYQYVSIRTDITHVKTAEAAMRANGERVHHG